MLLVDFYVVIPFIRIQVTAEDSQWQKGWGASWRVILLQETFYIQPKVICPWKIVRISTHFTNNLKKEKGIHTNICIYTEIHQILQSAVFYYYYFFFNEAVVTSHIMIPKENMSTRSS